MHHIILSLVLIGPVQQSDDHLKGEALQRFLATSGASHVGRPVHWHVPAGVFLRPKDAAKGFDLYVHKKIGLLISSGHLRLAEVRRRGGTACVRGEVLRVPANKKRPGDPDYALAIRDMARRKK